MAANVLWLADVPDVESTPTKLPVLKAQKHQTDLEDGVHDAGERPVVGELSHSEDVDAPLVDALQLLFQVR